MLEKSDAALVADAARGDERAFETLIRRYESLMASVVRRYVRDVHQADDILQETLLQAWTGLETLRDPDAVASWLAQIARNRARDHVRAAAQRHDPTEPTELEQLVSRYGRDTVRRSEAAAEAIQSLDRAPEAQREAARLFYLDGFTIDEIASRRSRPVGSIKRYLHDARVHMRRELGVPEPLSKEHPMSRHKAGTMHQPFPTRCPDIVTEPSDEAVFAVDSPEMRWWFVALEVGSQSMWASYDPPTESDRGVEWRLTGISDMAVTRKARIHDLDCVEVIGDYWEPDSGWKPSQYVYYQRLTDDSVEVVAGGYVDSDGTLNLLTYLDAEFEKRWGPTAVKRRMMDARSLRQNDDGSYEVAPPEPGEVIGAGAYTVAVGDKTETCLRVFDLHGDEPEDTLLMEGFVTRDGRAMLSRRYNGVEWQSERRGYRWDERYPDNERLVINGVTYVHWYDCIPGWPLGIGG